MNRARRERAMELLVHATGEAEWNRRRMRCALGRAGVRADKREGDGATPVGTFALSRVLYRADRIPPPETALAVRPLDANDGWCDEPADPDYNRMVRLPHDGQCERLWRDDGVYDVLVVLGHNDSPVRPGTGSAIFLHLARPQFPPTEGCVALAAGDLLDVLATCRAGDRLRVIGGD